MSQFFGLLSPGLLLRSLFSGAFFLIAFCVAVDGPPQFAHLRVAGELGTALSISLFAGVVVYTLHRSVIYALIEWLINSSEMRQLRKRVPLISTETTRALLKQWKRASNSAEVEMERGKHFSTWADYAHLQYTAALCILFGTWCGRIGAQGTGIVYWPLVVLACTFALAAFVADWRLHAVREHVEDTVNAEPTIV